MGQSTGASRGGAIGWGIAGTRSAVKIRSSTITLILRATLTKGTPHHMACSACGARGARARCRGCQTAVYCGKECQRNHWSRWDRGAARDCVLRRPIPFTSTYAGALRAPTAATARSAPVAGNNNSRSNDNGNGNNGNKISRTTSK